MAAEGLLYDLKQGFLSGKDAEIQVFLSPAIEKNDTLDLDEMISYGRYAIRFLHAYTTQFDRVTGDDMPEVLNTILYCCQCASECKAAGPEPLTMEKLLMHILIKAVKKGFLVESLKLANLLLTELKKCSQDFKTAVQNIAHGGFVSLWNSALQQEKNDKNVDMVMCLKLRHCAVMLLHLSGKADIASVVDKVRVTVETFDHNLANLSKTGKLPKDKEKEVNKAQELINDFVDHLVKDYLKDESTLSVSVLMACVELQMKQVKLLLFHGKFQDCISAVNKLQNLLNSKPCNMDKHIVPELDVCNLCSTFLLLSVQICQNMKFKDNCKKMAVPWDTILSRLNNCEKKVLAIQSSKTLGKGTQQSMTRLLSSCSLLCFQQFGEDITRNRNTSTLSTLPQTLQDAVLECHDLVATILNLEVKFISKYLSKQKDPESVSVKRLKYVRGEEIRIMMNKLYAFHTLLQDCKDVSVVCCLAEKSVQVLNKLVKVVGTGVNAEDCPLDHEEYLHTGNVASRLGRTCYYKLAYSAALPLLEISCSQIRLWSEKTTQGNANAQGLWRKHEVLADTQRRLGLFEAARDTIVLGLLCDHSQVSLVAELWVKIKIDAAKQDPSSDWMLRCLNDAVVSHNSEIPAQKILEAELKASKANRARMLDTQLLLVERLLDLPLSSYSRGCHLVAKAQIIWVTRKADNSVPLELCQEAVQELEKVAAEENQSEFPDLYDHLAQALLWNYIVQDVDPSQIQFKSGKMSKDGSRPSSPNTDLKQAETHGDVTTVAHEQKAVAGLSRALDLWEGLLEQQADGKSLACPQSTMDQIAILVAIFKLLQKNNFLMRSLRLLIKLAKTVGNHDYYLRGQAQQMQLYCSMRQPLLAAAAALETESFLLSAKTEVAKNGLGYIYFLLARAETDLMQNKVLEGRRHLWQAVQRKSQCVRGKSKEGLLLEGALRQLQSRFQSLPSCDESYAVKCDTEVSPCDELIDLDSPLDLQVRGVRCVTGVVCCTLGESMLSSKGKMQAKVPDNAVEKWDILERLLSSLATAGQCYLDIGEAREATCFLQQGLRLAKAFHLPTRCATFELILSQLYTLQHKFDTCQANLNTVQFILHTGMNVDQRDNRAEHSNEVKKVKKSSVSFGFSDSEDDIEGDAGDPDFIKTKPMDLSDEDKSLSKDSTNDACGSPSLQKKCPLPPDFWSHDVNCLCSRCKDMCLSRLHLMYLAQQAQCLYCQGRIEEAQDFWHFFLLNFDKVTMKAQQSFTELLEKWTNRPEPKCQKDKENVKIMNKPVSLNPSFFQGFLVDVCLELTEFSIEEPNPNLFEEWSTKARELLDLEKFPWMVESQNDLVKLEILQSVGSVPWPEASLQDDPVNIDQLCKQISHVRLADQPTLETPANPISKKRGRKKVPAVKQKNKRKEVLEEESVEILDENKTPFESDRKKSAIGVTISQIDACQSTINDACVTSLEIVDKENLKDIVSNHSNKSAVRQGRSPKVRNTSIKGSKDSTSIQVKLKETENVPVDNGSKKTCPDMSSVKTSYKTPARKMKAKCTIPSGEDSLCNAKAPMDLKTPKTGNKIKLSEAEDDFSMMFKTPCSVNSRRAALAILIDSDSEEEKPKSVKKSVSQKPKRTTASNQIINSAAKKGRRKIEPIKEESPLKDFNREVKPAKTSFTKSPVYSLFKDAVTRTAALQQENVFDFICSEEEGVTPKTKPKGKGKAGKTKQNIGKNNPRSKLAVLGKAVTEEYSSQNEAQITDNISRKKSSTAKKTSSNCKATAKENSAENVSASTKTRRTRLTRGSASTIENSRWEKHPVEFTFDFPLEDSLYMPDDESGYSDNSALAGTESIFIPSLSPYDIYYSPGDQSICNPFPSRKSDVHVFQDTNPMELVRMNIKQGDDGVTDLAWRYQAVPELHSEVVSHQEHAGRPSMQPSINYRPPSNVLPSLGASSMVNSLRFSVISNLSSPDADSDCGRHSSTLNRSSPMYHQHGHVDQVKKGAINANSTHKSKRMMNQIFTFDPVEINRGDSGSDSDGTSSKSQCSRVKSNQKRKGESKQRLHKSTSVWDETEDTERPRMSKPKGVGAKDEINCQAFRPSKKGIGKCILVNQPGSENVLARLEQNFRLVCHYPPVLTYRSLCHNLATLHLHNGDTWQAAFYLNEAMAVTFRHNALVNIGKKLRRLGRDDTEGVDGLAQNLQSLDIATNFREQQLRMRQQLAFGKDTQYFTHMCNSLPEDLTICQLSVVSPSSQNPGHLLAARFSRGEDPRIVQLPGFSSPQGQRILVEFGIIMKESKETLSLTDKVAWWSQREALDEQLKNLLDDMEDQWFGCWRGFVFGKPSNKTDREQLTSATSNALMEIQELTSNEDGLDPCLVEVLLSSLHLLSEREMIEGVTYILKKASGCQTVTQNADNIIKMVDILKKFNKSLNPAVYSRQPVVLILDKGLQHLPWESLPILRGYPATRMPSLIFLHVHSSLLADGDTKSVLQAGVNPNNTFYILNPDNNLACTQVTFQKWFERLKGWSGITAQVPTSTEYTNALRTHDLFVYCGHGNGAKYLCGELLATCWCRAAVLLIGCSSGLLKNDGCLEAAGMMLHYLLAGCPCVVGNLWDVTDRDIDRYLESVLKKWFGEKDEPSLLHHIHASRNKCRLPYLVGAAPVVYGLPIKLTARKS